jgi:hypothetical protein
MKTPSPIQALDDHQAARLRAYAQELDRALNRPAPAQVAEQSGSRFGCALRLLADNLVNEAKRRHAQATAAFEAQTTVLFGIPTLESKASALPTKAHSGGGRAA